MPLLSAPACRERTIDRAFLRSILTFLAELTQNIARFIAEDKDIGNFRLICHATDNAVDSDGFSFWRHRFLDQFDAPKLGYTGGRVVNSAEIREEYKARKEMTNVIHPDFQKLGKVKPKLRFRVGHGNREKIALRVLRDLINGMHHEHSTCR